MKAGRPVGTTKNKDQERISLYVPRALLAKLRACYPYAPIAKAVRLVLAEKFGGEA